MTANKLPGRYKGTRRRHDPPAQVIFECPGCGWKSQPNKPEVAEMEYCLHLNNVHHGILECAFCHATGVRFLPDFATLSAHVRYFHPERFAGCLDGEIPPRSFKT